MDYFLPMRILPWSNLANSSNTALAASPGEKSIGFIPVYTDVNDIFRLYGNVEVKSFTLQEPEQRECISCDWTGPLSETGHPKHVPAQVLCPVCNDTTEPAPVIQWKDDPRRSFAKVHGPYGWRAYVVSSRPGAWSAGFADDVEHGERGSLGTEFTSQSDAKAACERHIKEK